MVTGLVNTKPSKRPFMLNLRTGWLPVCPVCGCGLNPAWTTVVFDTVCCYECARVPAGKTSDSAGLLKNHPLLENHRTVCAGVTFFTPLKAILPVNVFAWISHLESQSAPTKGYDA